DLGGVGGGGGTGGGGAGGGNGGKGDVPGTPAHGCAMAATHSGDAPLPILFVFGLVVALQLKKRDQKCRRGARGPA
ncbi:MAG TPA: hypothetical protein VF997_17645, partial [Polyangia bacterium]